MTRQEALQMIDSAVAQLNTTRAQHIQLQTAVTLLSQTADSEKKSLGVGDTKKK